MTLLFPSDKMLLEIEVQNVRTGVIHMITYAQESFYCEMNKQACSYTMYFPMLFDHTFQLERFKKAADYLFQNVPHLARKSVSGFWRARWVELEGFDSEQLFSCYRFSDGMLESEEEFYREALKAFQNLEDTRIDMETEAQLKFKVFADEKQRWTLVVLCIHHSIADGRGSMQIIDVLSRAYESAGGQEKLPKLENYRKVPVHALKDGFFTILKRTFRQEKEMQKHCKELFPTDLREEPRRENFEVVRLTKGELEELKEQYRPWNYSTNDILVYKLLKVSSRLGSGEPDEHAVLNIGIAIDHRKDIRRQILSITNYASMCPFYMNESDIQDLYKVKKQLQHFKQNAAGVSFSKEFLLLGMVPFAVQKKIFKGDVSNTIRAMSCRGIQTTNIGEITRHIGDFGSSLRHVEFIGPAGKFGMPIISISSYQGELAIYFRRTNDTTGICRKVREMFEEELETGKGTRDYVQELGSAI